MEGVEHNNRVSSKVFTTFREPIGSSSRFGTVMETTHSIRKQMALFDTQNFLSFFVFESVIKSWMWIDDHQDVMDLVVRLCIPVDRVK